MVRVGATRPIDLDLRLIVATSHTLTQEITEGRYREDLYYRLAVAVLKLPALRECTGDLGLLVDRPLNQINEERAHDPGYRNKKLSASARNVLLRHPWPGNVRKILNTLRRIAIRWDGATIEAEDVREALLPAPRIQGQGALDRTLGDGCSMPDLFANVARHHLTRAMEEAAGNKSRAAGLVDLASY